MQKVRLYFFGFALSLYFTPLVWAQTPSKYAQEYAAVVQNPESSINKRKKFLAQFLPGIPLEYRFLLTKLDLLVHTYDQYHFTSQEEASVCVSELQTVGTNHLTALNIESQLLRGKSAELYLALPKEFPLLYSYVEKISAKNKIQTPLLIVADDDRIINAFASASWDKRGIIIIGTGLLQQISSLGLETVLSHEIGHIVNRDTARQPLSRFSFLNAPVVLSYKLHLTLSSILGLNTSLAFLSATGVLKPGTTISLVSLSILTFILITLSKLIADKKAPVAEKENRADDFAKAQGCDAAAGLYEFETLLAEKRQELFTYYSKLIDQYYNDYVSQPDHSAHVAESINTLITTFKKNKVKAYELNGGRLSREQRAARLK